MRAKAKVIARISLCIGKFTYSKGERELRFDRVKCFLPTLRDAIVLKLQCSVVIQVISQAEGRTVPATHRRAVRRIPIDGFGDARVYVGIPEVGAIST